MKIAYLAPEIPALSATFVYNELLKLEQQGFEIFPFSVRKNDFVFHDEVLVRLQEKVVCLYTQSTWTVLKSHFHYLFNSPAVYFATLKNLLADVFSVGVTTRTALGLVYRFFYAAKLAQDLNRFQCQHLHVHFAHVPTDLAMYATQLAKISFSVTAHANDLFERAWLLQQKVSRSAFFATISEFNKQFLIQQGADAEKIFIVRCGVDSTQFSQRKNEPNNQAFKIGVLGRLIEKKGVDTLINAAFELKQQGIPFELSIAGSGELLNQLVAQVKELGLNDKNVKFLGAMPHQKVAEFIKSLDIFILPCKQDKAGDMDGIPVALMEAMLSGVPVISTELSGIPELVIDKKTGLLIQPNNAKQLAEAIKQLLENQSLRELCVVNAIEKVKTEFNLSTNVERLAHLFNSYVSN